MLQLKKMKMKIRLTIIAALISSSLLSQPKPIYLSQTKIGFLNCSVQQVNQANHKNPDLFVSIEFKNEGTRPNPGSISFDLQNDSLGISSSINDLNKAIVLVDNGTDQAWNNTDYLVKIFDVSATIHLCEPESKGGSNTEMIKRDAQRLVTWLEGIMKNRSKFLHQQNNHKVLAGL
jgi:hypothetical protein